MLYVISIPAQFTAAVAAGEVALMATAAGATTTLVASSGGAIVGTATLVPAAGTAATTATLGISSIGAGALLAATGVGLAVLGIIGLGCWALAEDQKRKDRGADSQPASEMSVVIEGTEDDARAVLAQVEAIIAGFDADVFNREPLRLSRL